MALSFGVVAPVTADEVATPFTSTFAVPTCVPPDAQSTAAGWHRKNVTVPVGVGCRAPPVIVAVSVTDVPGTTLPPVGLDAVVGVDGCFPVVKHSVPALVWFTAL